MADTTKSHLVLDGQDVEPVRDYLSQTKSLWAQAVDYLKLEGQPSQQVSAPETTFKAAPRHISPTSASATPVPPISIGESQSRNNIEQTRQDPDKTMSDVAIEQMIESTRFLPETCVADWDEDIVLERQLKTAIEQAVCGLIPVGHIKRTNGMLLYGTPGTGKSVMVAAVAKALGLPLFDVTKDVIMSKFQGDSEK